MVSDARARPDSGVGKLDRTVQPVNTACGKGIHGENHIWMGLFCRSAQDFHCLHARLCHNAGSKGTHFPALLSVGAHQMARNVKLLHRLRPERIRRDAAVAEAGHKNGSARFRHHFHQTVGKLLRRFPALLLVCRQKQRRFDRHIRPFRLSHHFCTLLRCDFHNGCLNFRLSFLLLNLDPGDLHMVPLKFFLILHRQVCPHPILSYHTFLLLLYFCCSFCNFFKNMY